VDLRDAVICFYGQRPGRLLSIFRNIRFRKFLEENARQAGTTKGNTVAPKLRLFNLGGNPMIMRLILGDVDAVIELEGQENQDVIPAAVIALKAGAVLYRLLVHDHSYEQITKDELHSLLSRPRQKLHYLMTASDRLAKALLKELQLKPAK